jgi:hypothetical protein
MAKETNKKELITGRRIDQAEELSDKIAAYIENAMLYFLKLQDVESKKNEYSNNAEYLAIASDITKNFGIDCKKIIIRIDDDYADIIKMVADIRLIVTRALEPERLGTLIDKLTTVTRDMLRNEKEKIATELGIKDKKIYLNFKIKKYLLNKSKEKGTNYSRLINFYIKQGIAATDAMKNGKNAGKEIFYDL